MIAGRALPLSIALLIPLALGGCREPPDVVLQNARDDLADLNKTGCGDKARIGEAIEAFARHVEPRAAAILRKAPEIEKTSSGLFTVFETCKPPPTVLPPGDIAGIDIGERRSVVKVKKPGSKTESDIPFVLVEGRWKVDLLEIPAFRASIQVQ